MREIWVMRGFLVAAALAVTGVGTGCSYQPPAPAPTPVDQPTDGSYDATWSAVIDYFADEQIRVETMEKVSGFIVASTSWVDAFSTLSAADCGRRGSTGYSPNFVRFNVRVKPVGEKATIRVNMEFTRIDGRPCESTGQWERRLVNRVVRQVAGIPR